MLLQRGACVPCRCALSELLLLPWCGLAGSRHSMAGNHLLGDGLRTTGVYDSVA
jgi:hypothetical protein